MRGFAQLVDALRGCEEDPAVLAGDTISAARVVAEDLSVTGLVDLAGCVFLHGALPDALISPNSLLCVIAAMVRLAAYPERAGISTGTLNDNWAAAEVATAFESSFAPVLSSKGGMLGIDVVLAAAIANATACATDEETALSASTMEFLFRAGTSACIDVCGPVQAEAPYTRFGMATTADEVCLAHIASARANGLGNLFDGVTAPRLTSRAERQTTLLRILDTVENFLRSGSSTDDGEGTGKRDEFQHAVPYTGEEAEKTKKTSLNMLAVKVVQSLLERVISRGPLVLEVENLDVYAVSRDASLACTGCQLQLHVLEATLFPGQRTHCQRCLRPFCFACSEENSLCALCGATAQETGA